MELIVKDIINNDLAISSESGQEIFEILDQNVTNKIRTNVNFSNLLTITTAFFNSAIGDLYAKWDPKDLNDYVHIEVTSLTDLQKEKLKLVMDNAKSKLTDEELKRY
ncbi:STAS-like domain-containing protein [Latilactobacillus sakei]|uniref:STAS-like domain-containing protein n=1 Tax=Latilactobacillus sakei TaxID=1599 RepID=UPI000976035A|nr:DUF4325 domain-containing protein [Latilactobacillus sakei]